MRESRVRPEIRFKLHRDYCIRQSLMSTFSASMLRQQMVREMGTEGAWNAMRDEHNAEVEIDTFSRRLFLLNWYC